MEDNCLNFLQTQKHNVSDPLMNRRLKSNYKTSNEFRLAPQNFTKWFASDCKRIREDFNDMFCAESKFRNDCGDVSVVFCLTYNDEHIPTAFGHHLADSWDLKRLNKSSRFAKRILRKFGVELDFVAVAEYGNGGKSHDFVGVRGVGENPHFHCCGWFHSVDGSRLAARITEQMYDELVDEIFLAWQGSTERDISRYGRDRVARSLGLGHVEFSGKIRSAAFGGAYIGKYIGKDIGKMHTSCMNDSVIPALYDRLHGIVQGVLDSQHLNTMYANRLFAFWLRFTDYNLRPLSIDLFSVWFTERFGKDLFTLDKKFLEHTHDINFPSLDSVLYENYCDIYNDFMDKMSSRYSPKLRKFHGFGYSLLDDCDKIKGTYQICRANATITRFLPASLVRHLYYDYNVSFRPVKKDYDTETMSYKYKYKRVVRYSLNELGRVALLDRLRRVIDLDIIYIKNYGSKELKENASLISCISHCLLTYYPTEYIFNEMDFCSIMFDKDKCLDYALSCRQFRVYGQLERDSRPCVDIRRYLFANHREIYNLLREFENLKYLRGKSKNDNDYQFNCYWLRCYDFNY